jgi:uncharacterized protein YerC
MPKVKVYNVDSNERYRIIGELFELVANLKTKKEVIDFLIGLFTRSETLMIARRIQIAKMLAEDESYETIRKKLKVSYQTIASVEHWLQSEEKRDFIIKKLKELDKGGKYKKYSGSLLNKYAHHRALKDLLG